jgi:hypothetical protein
MNTIQIYRGDTPKFTFAVKQRDGTPFPLASATVYFSAKIEGASDLLFDLTCDITDQDEGLAEKRLTATHTASIGTYKAEVEVRVVSGEDTFIFTAWQAYLEIIDDVRKGS